jgi:hypothetical protein
MSVRRIQIRRDTFQNFSNLNVTLHQGELGLDITNKRIKVGDGFTSWNNLEYIEKNAMDEIRTEYGDEVSFSTNYELYKQ